MPTFNLSMMLAHIIDKEDQPWRPSPTLKHRIPTEFCLPASLPSTSMFLPSSLLLTPTRVQGFLQREADSIAPKSLLRQSQQSPIPPSPQLLEEALSSSIVNVSPPKSPSSPTLSSIKQAISRKTSTNTTRKEWKEPEVRRVTIIYFSFSSHALSPLSCIVL